MTNCIKRACAASASLVLCSVASASGGPSWDFMFSGSSFSQFNQPAPGIGIGLVIVGVSSSGGTFTTPDGLSSGVVSRAERGSGTGEAFDNFAQFQALSATEAGGTWTLNAITVAGSAQYHFTADFSAISIPQVVINSPVHDAITSNLPTFQWSETGPGSTIVQIVNSDFSVNINQLLVPGQTSFTAPSSLPAGTYSFYLGKSLATTAVPIHLTRVSGPDLNIIPNGTFSFLSQAYESFTVPAAHWNHDADGDWSTPSNWSAAVPSNVGDTANFLNTITAPRTINVDAPQTVAHLLFDSAVQYTIAGSHPLTISNAALAADITANQGAHLITAPLVISSPTNLNVAAGATLSLAGNLSVPNVATLTKVGPGTLTISGPQAHAAGTFFNATEGTTNFNSDPGSNLFVAANAIVNFGTGASVTHIGSLDVQSAGKVTLNLSASHASRTVLVTSGLTFAGSSAQWQGLLDLTNNDLIVHNGDLSAISGQIAQAYDFSNWDGAGGITSSAARASTSPKTALGYGSFVGTFDGQAVTGSDVVMMYTLVGDTNLDGVVDFTDLVSLAQHYGTTGTDWSRGDFTYDGVTNFQDLVGLAQGYDQNVSLTASQISQLNNVGGKSFASDWALATALLPEPGSVAIAFTAAAAFVRRRRWPSSAIPSSPGRPMSERITSGRTVSSD